MCALTMATLPQIVINRSPCPSIDGCPNNQNGVQQQNSDNSQDQDSCILVASVAHAPCGNPNWDGGRSASGHGAKQSNQLAVHPVACNSFAPRNVSMEFSFCCTLNNDPLHSAAAPMPTFGQVHLLAAVALIRIGSQMTCRVLQNRSLEYCPVIPSPTPKSISTCWAARTGSIQLEIARQLRRRTHSARFESAGDVSQRATIPRSRRIGLGVPSKLLSLQIPQGGSRDAALLFGKSTRSAGCPGLAVEWVLTSTKMIVFCCRRSMAIRSISPARSDSLSCDRPSRALSVAATCAAACSPRRPTGAAAIDAAEAQDRRSDREVWPGYLAFSHLRPLAPRQDATEADVRAKSRVPKDVSSHRARNDE